MYSTYKEFDECKLKCRECPVGLIYDRVVLSVGNKVDPLYMVIGEAPGKDEVKVGQPFVGKAGNVLRKECITNRLTPKNTLITNTIPCRPENNQFPNDKDLVCRCMRRWILEEIQLIKPKYILLVGATPTKYVLGIKTPISKVRGQVFEGLTIQAESGEDTFQDCYNIPNIKCIPTFHPSYIVRNGSSELGKIVREQFQSDIRKFANLPSSNVDMNPTF